MPKGVYKKKLGVHGKYKRTPEILEKLSTSIRESLLHQAVTQDPTWRKRVSESTKERMHDPDIRERRLAGLEGARNRSPTGNSWRGGQGQEPNTLEKSYDWLLLAGYQSNFPVYVTAASHEAPPIWYRLDYALPEAMLCFEIDGPTHRYKIEQDANKDTTLLTLGWKVIRIRHWS